MCVFAIMDSTEPSRNPKRESDKMTPHIDTEQLAELKEVLEDEFSVLIDTYLTDAKLRLNLIKNGIATQDYEAVRLAAHSLKGASANLGAQALAQLCEKLEHDCKVGHYAEFDALFLQAQAEFVEVNQQLLMMA